MVSNHTKAFFDPIKRNKQPNFKTTEMKLKVKNVSSEEVKVERNILGTLLAEATLSGDEVDIEKALAYPLSPVSVPLCTADGSRRKTTKRDLFSAFENIEWK